jgi:hypothetical protein
MLHRFEPFVAKGEISNLPAYNFYIRIQAEESLEPMSGITVVLPEEGANETIASAVVKASQDAYATTYVKPITTDKPKAKEGHSSEGPESQGDKGGGQKDNRTKQSNGGLDSNNDNL